MNWSLMEMVRSMGGLAKGVVGMLLLMFAISCAVMIARGLRYWAARQQSRAFVRQVAPALKEGELDQAIAVAQRNRKSHIAAVVGSGLSDFQAAPSLGTDAELIAAAQRGLDRSTTLVHAELGRGLSGLATIGATAPFVGLFGTVLGIMNAFQGATMTAAKTAGLGAVGPGIAEALVTTALGLSVAVPAVWCYNYFSSAMESFDTEMQTSSLELVTYLTQRLEQRRR